MALGENVTDVTTMAMVVTSVTFSPNAIVMAKGLTRVGFWVPSEISCFTDDEDIQIIQIEPKIKL